MAQSMCVVLRSKGQVTIPKAICDLFGIGAGDMLEMRVEGAQIVAVPRKAQARVALAEIREAFRRAGVSEEDLQAAGRQARQAVHRERARAGA